MKLRKKFTIMEANLFFLILGIVFLSLGSVVQTLNFELGIIITEYIIILLPILLYAKFKNIDIKSTFRFNKISIKTGALVVAMGLFLVPIIGFGNIIVMVVLDRFDLVMVNNVPSASTFSEMIKYLFIIGVSAGICEEVFFRGMILNAYEKNSSPWFAAIMSSVLFGVFHFNVQNLIGPMLLGFIFSYIVLVTDSILPAIIAHFLNNSTAVVLGFLVSQSGIEQTNQVFTMNEEGIIGVISLGVMAAFCSGIVYLIAKAIKKDAYTFSENTTFEFRSKDAIERYFVVKNKKDKIIIMDDSYASRERSAKELLNQLKYIDKRKIKNMTYKPVSHSLIKKQIEFKVKEYIPIFISFVMYVVFMVYIWNLYDLI